MNETLFKVLAADGCSPQHGGKGKWEIPHNGQPGTWMPKISPVKLCQQGYHVVKGKDLIEWAGPTLYTVEVRGEFIYQDTKGVAEQARLLHRVETWNDKTLRLFAADCAEHTLPLFEKIFPNDKRPRNAIKVVRDFVEGKVGLQELKAAREAAGAAWEAAGAARDAAGAAWAAWAARDAAGEAAGDAAREAERQWQRERLAYYLEIEL